MSHDPRGGIEIPRVSLIRIVLLAVSDSRSFFRLSEATTALQLQKQLINRRPASRDADPV